MPRAFKKPPAARGTAQDQLKDLREYLTSLVRELEITVSMLEKKIREEGGHGGA